MADLTDVSPGDLVTSSRQNDINDYIQDGTHLLNTLSINVGATEIITSARALTNLTIDADGTGNSITNIENADIKTAAAIDATKIADGTVTSQEFQYINSLTGNAQTQITAKMGDLIDDTTPQLGGNLDLNQKSIQLDPTPTSNLTFNGLFINAAVGENVAIGDILYLKASDSKFWKMDADAVATSKGQCVMATGTITTGNSGNLLTYGYIRYDTWTWTVAADLYVSCTPGNPTATAPSATGDFVRIIGQAQSADIIFFNPDNTYIEVS